MRFNPSFIQLRTTIDKANDFETSIDNANPSRSWLRFCPNEVYNQYIAIDENLKTLFHTSEIIRAELCDGNGSVLNDNLGFGYKKYLNSGFLLLSFKITEDYGDKCLCIRLKFNGSIVVGYGKQAEQYSHLYSNLFTCTETNRQTTSIVTYKHSENFYGTPYREDVEQSYGKTSGNSNQTEIKFYNQIRLPLYFLRWKSEQDSTENTYSTNTPVNINVSRVQRRKIKIWQTIANDWINERLDVVSDSDFVYINGQREITRPYEYQETSNGSDFSLSFLESQPVYGDEYLDEFGLVNHRPVITAINFPNGNCCTPDGEPAIEPVIASQTIQADTCDYGGIHKLITISGEPDSTIKYRLTASQVIGTSKEIKVYNTDVNNSYIFDYTPDVYIGYFYTDSEGSATLNIKCCLEDCTPGQDIAINADLELYKMDGVTLSGQICNIQKSKSCPMPQSPVWVIISETGTQIKRVKISGDPNATAIVRIRVLSSVDSGLPPLNYIKVEGVPDGYQFTDVDTGEFWDIPINIDSTGESEEYDVSVSAGKRGFLPIPAQIYVTFTLLDLNGDLSDEIFGLSDINTI